MTTQLSQQETKRLKEQLNKAKQQSIEAAADKEQEEEEDNTIPHNLGNISGGLGITSGSNMSTSTLLNSTGIASIGSGQTLTIDTATSNWTTTLQQDPRRMIFIFDPKTDITVKEMALCMMYMQPHYPKYFIEDDPMLDEPFTRHFLIEGRDDDAIAEWK